MNKILDIALSDILSDDKFNCRGRIAPVKVFELAQDIKENGLLQPIVVQPWSSKKYRIVCGHRRFMAFRVNGAETIPAIVRTDISDDDAMLLNLTENINRQDLNLMQEARAIGRFMKLGWHPDRIASKLSVSPMWLRARTALLKLEPEIQRRAEAGLLTQHQIMDISRMPTSRDRMAATQKAVEHKLMGEKKSLKVGPKKKDVFVKKPRSIAEIHEMQDLVRDVLGNNLTTRFAAYAAGVISARDFHWDLQEAARERGIEWEIPIVVEMPPS